MGLSNHPFEKPVFVWQTKCYASNARIVIRKTLLKEDLSSSSFFSLLHPEDQNDSSYASSFFSFFFFFFFSRLLPRSLFFSLSLPVFHRLSSLMGSFVGGEPLLLLYRWFGNDQKWNRMTCSFLVARPTVIKDDRTGYILIHVY